MAKKFEYGEHLTTADHIISSKLGTSGVKLVDSDVGHPVKLGADSTHVKCADGDQIEAFIRSVEPWTTDGLSFGGIQVGGFKAVTVLGAIAIGDYVVASTNGRVKKAPTLAAGDTFRWRYVAGEVGAGSSTEYSGVVKRA